MAWPFGLYCSHSRKQCTKNEEDIVSASVNVSSRRPFPSRDLIEMEGWKGRGKGRLSLADRAVQQSKDLLGAGCQRSLRRDGKQGNNVKQSQA